MTSGSAVAVSTAVITEPSAMQVSDRRLAS